MDATDGIITTIPITRDAEEYLKALKLIDTEILRWFILPPHLIESQPLCSIDPDRKLE